MAVLVVTRKEGEYTVGGSKQVCVFYDTASYSRNSHLSNGSSLTSLFVSDTHCKKQPGKAHTYSKHTQATQR